MQKIIAVLALLFLVPVSGCVFPGFNPFDSKTPPQTGVLIEDFSPDFQTVRSGEQVTFLMKVKNTGSVTAKDGFAELLGLDQAWNGGSGASASKTNEIFPSENTCRYDIKGISLLPADADAGTTGGETTCTWKYVAPQVLPGLTVKAKPSVRFYYTYSSSTVKTITIATREELKSYEEQGKTLPSESSSKTNSPVSIDIETSTPIRTYANSVEFPVVITMKNIGGGTVCAESSPNCKKSGSLQDAPDWNKFFVVISLPAGLKFAADSCAPVEEIIFIGNNPQTISCKLTADIGNQIGISQKNIEITSTYGYFIDKSTEVNVLPPA
jgi:hypothetical protein